MSKPEDQGNMQKVRENLNQILLGLLIAAISIIGLMNKSHLDSIQAAFQHNFDQMWGKLDRVTALMMQKEESLRADDRVLKEELICIGKEVERMKTQMEFTGPVNGNGKKK